MKLRLLLSLGLLSLASSTQAAVIATWTFETSIPATAGPHAAEEGTGTATGFHTTTTTYSNPTGNGSAESFSSSNWTVGDYYQFAVSTVDYFGITLRFDQTGSNTGPRDFKVQYSTDGTAFTDVVGGAYAVINDSWGPAARKETSSYSFDLSSITALDNQPNLLFRLTDTSTVAISSANPVATGGTSRVDNVTVVPEPTSALLGAVGILGLLRRRR